MGPGYQYQGRQEFILAYFQIIHRKVQFKCPILPAYSSMSVLLLQKLIGTLSTDDEWDDDDE